MSATRKHPYKLPLTSCVALLLLTSMTACALLERHYSYIRYRDDDGMLGFEYHLGIHRLQKEASKRKLAQEEVTLLLMEEALKKDGLCNLGSAPLKTLVTQRQDRVVLGTCKPANNQAR